MVPRVKIDGGLPKPTHIWSPPPPNLAEVVMDLVEPGPNSAEAGPIFVITHPSLVDPYQSLVFPPPQNKTWPHPWPKTSKRVCSGYPLEDPRRRTGEMAPLGGRRPTKRPKEVCRPGRRRPPQ